MINFFRKIRRKYADDNKPLKYARYAIGEILLVVIGILIALQVNNWNEEKKTRAVELNYLENIKSDLELNLVELKEFIVERRKSIKSSDSILVMFEGGAKLDLNAFNRYSINVMVWFPLEYHDNTYQELVNSGKLSIINNKVSVGAIDILFFLRKGDPHADKSGIGSSRLGPLFVVGSWWYLPGWISAFRKTAGS